MKAIDAVLFIFGVVALVVFMAGLEDMALWFSW